MEQINVSVIIAAYNEEKNILGCIQSLLQQDFENFEIIVVNDASTDSTSEILANNSFNRVRVINLTENQGVSIARNTAAKIANGKYLAILDADDLALPERLRTQSSYLEKHPDIALVGSFVRLCDMFGNEQIGIHPLGYDEIKKAALYCCPIWNTTVMVRKSVFMEMGGYASHLNQGEDYRFFASVVKDHRVENIDKVLVIKRESKKGLTFGITPWKLFKLALSDRIFAARELNASWQSYVRIFFVCLGIYFFRLLNLNKENIKRIILKRKGLKNSNISKIKSSIANYFSNRPFHFIFYITSACNAKCPFCYYSAEINKKGVAELSLKEMKMTFSKLGKIPYFSLSGGEPFLRKEIYDVLEYVCQKNKPDVISIPTNGSLPDEIYDLFNKLCSKFPNTQFYLQLSIDAYGEKHDRLRKIPNLFKKVLETNELAARLLQKYINFSIKIVTIYTSFNQEDVEELIEFVNKNMVFNRYILSWPHGTCSEETLKGLDKGKYRRLLKGIEKINNKKQKENNLMTKFAIAINNFKEDLREYWDANENLGNYCKAGKKILVLGETGKLFPCEPLWENLGNVRDYDYDIYKILANNYQAFHEKYIQNGCHCNWGCAQNIAIVSNPFLWRYKIIPPKKKRYLDKYLILTLLFKVF